MTKEDFLLMVLRAALWRQKLKGSSLPHDLYSIAMGMAERQTVVGLLDAVLMNPANGVRLERFDAIDTYSSYMREVDANQHLNIQLQALCQLLGDAQVPFVVVKGSTIAALYPEPLARTAGDIDFYVDACHWERAKRLMVERWNVSFEEQADDEEQHVAFSHEGVEFEMHFRLLKFASRGVQRVFDEMIAQCQPCRRQVAGVDVPILPPVEELIYTFLHLYHHFVELGIGLRQICDFAILLMSQEWTQQECDTIHRWLSRLGFLRAFRAFEALCVEKLGVDESRLPVPVEASDRSHIAAILEVVFGRGNFGKYGRTQAVRSGMGYYVEAFSCKLRQYLRFYRLSPKEARSVLLFDIPHKIFLAFRRRA